MKVLDTSRELSATNIALDETEMEVFSMNVALDKISAMKVFSTDVVLNEMAAMQVFMMNQSIPANERTITEQYHLIDGRRLHTESPTLKMACTP